MPLRSFKWNKPGVSGRSLTFWYLPVDCVISFTAFLWLILALVAPNFLIESNLSDMMRQVSLEESLPLVSFARLSLPESIDLSAPSSRSAAFLFAQALSHDYGITPSLAPTSRSALWKRPRLRPCDRSPQRSRDCALGIPAFIVTLPGLEVYRG
jgi:ribose transport system permease protein